VTVDGQLVSQIAKGILVFAAIGKDDTKKEAENMASKVLKMKFWEDDQGVKWKKNVQEIEGEVLCGAPPCVLSSRADQLPISCGLCELQTLTARSEPVHFACIYEKRQ